MTPWFLWTCRPNKEDLWAVRTLGERIDPEGSVITKLSGLCLGLQTPCSRNAKSKDQGQNRTTRVMIKGDGTFNITVTKDGTAPSAVPAKQTKDNGIRELSGRASRTESLLVVHVSKCLEMEFANSFPKSSHARLCLVEVLPE